MLLGVAFASSLSLYADADQARIQGTEARVFVWLTNTDGVAKTVAFSASDGELNGFFEDSGFILPASGSKGTWLHLRAPDCFRGAETVRVYADVCSSPTSCTTLQKTVLIIANPSGACNSYVGSFVSPYGVGQPMAYGDGSVVYSTLTYASDFQPTDYSVDVLGSDRCVPLKPGEQATVPLTVVNNGAASTFEVRVLSEGHDLSLLISPQSLSLSRGEAFDLRASIIPQSGHAPGRRYASVQVMRHGVVLFEKSVCVDVREQFEAEVKLPSSASGMQCEPIELDGVVKNTGNVGDSFEVTGPANAIVMPNGFMVDAGESRAFKIILPENSLRAGQSEVLVTAKSSARDIVGSARLLVNAQSCAPAVLPGDAVKPIQSQGDNGVKLTVGVTNGFDVPLTNVTARVEGIPPSWRGIICCGSDCAPGYGQPFDFNIPLWKRGCVKPGFGHFERRQGDCPQAFAADEGVRRINRPVYRPFAEQPFDRNALACCLGRNSACCKAPAFAKRLSRALQGQPEFNKARD